MNWFLARIIFRIVCGDGQHTPQFDEQFRLIMAFDEKDALEKASVIGSREEEPFLNLHMQKVVWKFEGVTELVRLKELRDGMELFSQIMENDDAERHVSDVHRKYSSLMSKIAQPA